MHYLCNTSIKIDGVKFYGVPMFMGDCITDRQGLNYANIPSDVNVLITHTPPYGILDFNDEVNYGSKELLERVNAIQPRLHLFGHIHKNHGRTQIGPTLFSNAAIMNEDYPNLQSPEIIEV